MAEPRKVNSNVEHYKAMGKRFGGAEGKKQDQEDLVKDEGSPSETPNVITGPIVTDKIKVKPLTDKELKDAQGKDQEMAAKKVET